MRQRGERHVKLTEHFLEVARDCMAGADMQRLMRALARGDLQRTARAECSCPGQDRLVISVGCTAVVFTLDERDPDLTSVLTVLSPEEQACLSRRLDTRLVRVVGAGRD